LLQHYLIAKGLTFNETNYQQETKRIQEALQKNAYSPTACDGLLTKFGYHKQIIAIVLSNIFTPTRKRLEFKHASQ